MSTNKNNRILFILPDTEMGGAERQAVLLSKELSEKYIVDFLCLHFQKRKYKVPEALKNSNVNVVIIESIFPTNRMCQIFRLAQIAWFCLFKRYYAVFPYLYEMCIDIGILKYMRLLNANIAVWNQRDEGFKGKLTKINKAILPYYDVFISNSLGGCSFLENTLSVPHNKIHYIKNGVDIKPTISRNSWRIAHQIADDEFVLCMLANIHSNKDHLTVIRAIKQINDRGLKVKMLLVGYPGNTIDLVKQTILESGLTNSVILFGAVQDVGSLLNAVDASVLSSPSEGLSNAMLESMAMKVPFIGTRISGITNVLGNDYPLLFEVGNANQLADCIQMVMEKSECIENIVSSNVMLIERVFSVTRLKQETLALIEKNK